MRRICCFCETWESGGIESFLNNVLLHIDLSELEVDIVAECIKESVFTSGLKARGIRFIELSGKLRSPQNYRRFRNLLRERKYDVVHLNLFQGLSLYYAQIAKKENVPVRIAHSHGSGLRNSRTKQIKMALHQMGRRAWTSAATDHWACSQLAARFLFSDINSFCMIPNGIETERFRFNPVVRDKIRSEFGLSEHYVVGHVGRLSSEKNQSFLLDVFAQLIKGCPSSRLLLVGDGPDKMMLQQQAERLGIAEHVIFYGVSKHVEQLLWAMDVFAFPSLFEGLGLACIEAQAAGLPVICSEGVPEEARITSLVSVLSFDAERWAGQLLTMCVEKRDTYAEAVRAAGFDVADVAQQIEKSWLG